LINIFVSGVFNYIYYWKIRTSDNANVGFDGKAEYDATKVGFNEERRNM